MLEPCFSLSSAVARCSGEQAISFPTTPRAGLGAPSNFYSDSHRGASPTSPFQGARACTREALLYLSNSDTSDLGFKETLLSHAHDFINGILGSGGRCHQAAPTPPFHAQSVTNATRTYMWESSDLFLKVATGKDVRGNAVDFSCSWIHEILSIYMLGILSVAGIGARETLQFHRGVRHLGSGGLGRQAAPTDLSNFKVSSKVCGMAVLFF